MRTAIFTICLVSITLTAGRVACASQNTTHEITPESTASSVFSISLLNELNQCLQQTEQYYVDDPDFSFDISQHCPALSRVLTNDNLSAYLQQPLNKNVTFDQLMDLQSLTTTILSHNETAYRFDLAGLQNILQNTLIPEQEQDLSLWKRFLNWLAEFFEKTERKQPDWLKNWLSKWSIPAWFVEAFYKGVVILLGILLAVVVITEVRAAGISRWFKERPQLARVRGSQAAIAKDEFLSWETISQLPSRERIVASYTKLLFLLTTKNLLPGDASLTNYELQSRLEKTLGGEQPAFRQLIGAVEATLYGDKTLDKDAIEQITHGARHFADSLDTRA